MIDQIEKIKCTGCKMCGDVCQSKAISFEINEQGFWYPVVDKTKCIKCGLCIRKCTINKDEVFVDKRKAYAAWSKNDAVRRDSTSGGVYYELANAVLDKGGYIVGSVYTEDYCGAYHIASNNKDDLRKIMGSKYFQSDTEGIYEKTRKLLNEGEYVFFTGLPCQVYALKRYLNNKDYDNLLTLDLLCRGVPSPKLQKRKIELYEKKYCSKIKTYRDKSKNIGWSNFGEYMTFQNGKKCFISRWEDQINNCFIEKNLNLRESCYLCDLKDGRTAADLTAGDFWGVHPTTRKDDVFGVSCLIANTDKGNSFINSIRSNLYLDRADINEIRSGNPAYVSAPSRPQKRDLFFESVNIMGLKKTVKKNTHLSIKQRIRIELRKIWPFISKYKFFIKNIKSIRLLTFIKLNFFSKNIKRDAGCYVFPMHGSYLDIEKTSRIVLHGNLTVNNYVHYRRGNQQAFLKMRENALLVVNDDINLAYGNLMSIGSNACLISGRLLTGVDAKIICNFKMTFGNRVMIGRNVCIFDSDFHPVLNENMERVNENKKVIIGDNCWIGANSMILKGSNIGHGAIISANTMVMGNVEENRVFVNKREAKSIGENVYWRI